MSILRQAVLIFNPASGRGRAKHDRLGELRAWLAQKGIEAAPLPTEGPGHATTLTREALGAGVELVIAWGGDGTLNEVVRGALGSSMPIGILPGGTVNVFAREVGIPLSMASAVEMLVMGAPRSVPVGMAGGRPFLLMAGVGLDAEVVCTLGPRFKKALGKYAYWLHGFRLLATHRFARLLVRSNGREVEATSLIAGKIPRYGPGYVITPEARLEEPRLDVVLFQGRRGRDYLRYLYGVAAGRHLGFLDVQHFKTDHLSVHSDGVVHYQLDGEAAGTLPVTIDVRANAVQLILPTPSTTWSRG